MTQQSETGCRNTGRSGPTVLGPMGLDYIPTEEERRVFRECNEESFWYRSLPISVISMGLTQLLISRGALTASGRFGSLPKVAFAGVCGYLGGKMSYMKTCKEKFKSLENSPLGEALKQRDQRHPSTFTNDHTELHDSKTGNQPFSYARDFPSSDSKTSVSHFDTQMTESAYTEENVQKKSVLYKDIQSKNREKYDITETQKADITSPKKGKKNIYGDTWEE